MSDSIQVRPVRGRSEWRAFLAMADRVQSADRQWIQPLRMERRKQWSARQPFFEHAEARAFVAWRDREPVGVISAQIDARAPRREGQRVGWFGQIEAFDEREIFAALVDAASAWLSSGGCRWMQGPYDLGINQSCGLLIEGQDSPPMLMMGHAPAYYAAHLEALGFDRAMDLLAYLLPPHFERPAVMQRLKQRLESRLSLRPLDFSRYDGELNLLRELFNDAWSANWGFVPLSAEEFIAMGREMRQIIRPAHTCVAELDGQPAGFLIALPNINELIADLNGRLLPLGWARLLWRLKRRQVRTARVPLMGVRQAHQRGMLGAAISFSMIDRVARALTADGIDQVEMSWILETNQGMNSMIEAMGGQLYKRYRLFERSLPASGAAV